MGRILPSPENAAEEAGEERQKRKAEILRGTKRMKLSERLERVISFVEPAVSAADIGTDHGYVPMELVRRGTAEHALAMDVRPGPLSRARDHIAQAGLENQIETRLSDGLAKLSAGEADAVIISGMGGELTIRILAEGVHMWKMVRQWVLSPHSEVFKVRRYLWEHGFSIVREEMVLEDEKYYTILDVRPGNGERIIKGEDETDGNKAMGPELKAEAPWGKREYYGEFLPSSMSPAFSQYLKEEERRLLELCGTLEVQAERSSRAGKRLKETKQRLLWNREVQNEVQGNH